MVPNARIYGAAWAIALLASLCAGGAYRSGPLANPIRSATTPPSGYESGLVTTPNPLSDGRNNIITGNVRGGKHFRGNVPYRSTTSFRGTLGSTSLDSFLRYSAIPQELGVTSRSTSGFYSPTGTVTTMPPGQNRVFAPTRPRVARGAGQLRTEVPWDVLDVPEIPQPQISIGDRGTALETNWIDWQRLRSWPLSPVERDVPYGDNEAEGSFVDPGASLAQDQTVVSDAHRRELVPSEYRPLDVETSAARPEQTLGLDEHVARQPSARASAEVFEDSDRLRRLFDTSASVPGRMPGPAQPASVEQSRQDAGSGAETVSPEQPGLELYRPTADRAARLAPEPASRTNSLDALFLSSPTGQAAGEAVALPAMQRIEETSGAFDRAKDLLQRPIGSETPPKETQPQTGLRRLGGSDGDSKADQIATILARWRTGPPHDSRSAPGLGIAPRGDASGGSDVFESKSPDSVHAPYRYAGSFLAERYGRYMAAAELYLQQGRHYRAAECFTLASLSRPSDAVARLGKAHALFAAGDYLSSAIALAEAIHLDPRHVLRRHDLAGAISEPGGLEARLADLDDCLEGRDVPLLQFLAAYVRYQIGDLAGAKTALEAAAKGLPSFPALDLLGATIGQ
jgi:tetratricopeptide (TPR) repeat protein